MIGSQPLHLAQTVCRDSDPYGLALGRVYSNRCQFVTDKKQLGLGRISLRSGDKVWCLPGAKVPFILHPVPSHARENTFNVVGETYVHGYMHGEVFGEDTRFEIVYKQ